MSEEDIKRSSHWIGWTVTVLLMPVVYVLMLGPLVAVTVYDPGTDAFTPWPHWLVLLAEPAAQLYDHVPMLRPLMESYMNWWTIALAGRPHP